mmetsp:Transcript_1218/g.1986  ORF Transcript_1218/g.1986 Transcript_1218/m.1986 type:complete len:748 (-) Transcript_1218:122-2365(-)
MGKKDKSSKKSSEQAEDVKREQKLQAILLAVSFTKYFRPISYVKPKVLVPLVNIPMLTYTIEFLSQNGVEEIFIFCVRHTELLQRFVDNLKLPSNLTVKCIYSRSCLSQGDALRELDAMGIIRSDPFILINGDVVSNMNLKKAIAFHKSRRQQDSNCIMTVVMKQVEPRTDVRPICDDLVVAYDRHTSQLLLFDSDVCKDGVEISTDILRSSPGLRIRTDLLDCQIDICSPELLLQFSDNFDYQDIRKHFIKNEVVNWELGEHIYTYVIQKEYAAQVLDPRTYHAICRDIVRRWVHPLTPDAHLLGDTEYVQGRHYCYKEEGVKVARSARIGEGVVLGRGSVIEEGAFISHCTIGRSCRVGKGAVLRQSHLWEGVCIEAGATVTHSIIAENAVVKAGACLERGCILATGVVVGPGVRLPPFTRVGSSKHPDEELSEDEDSDNDEAEGNNGEEKASGVLGEGGRGFIWEFGDDVGAEFGIESDSDEEEGTSDNLLPGGKVAAYRASCIGCTEQEIWKRALWSGLDPVVDSDDDSEEDEEQILRDRLSSSASAEDYDMKRYDADFSRIVGDMVTTGRKEGHPADNLLMEIKGFKFAQNKEFSDCVRGVVLALLTIVTEECESSSPTELIARLKGMFGLEQWGYQLVYALLQEHTDAASAIESVEDFVLNVDRRLYPVFRFILQIMYDSELLSEDSLLTWADTRESGSHIAENKKTLFMEPQVQEFVEWLREGDDDDSDEDEDDSDEDDN